MCIDGCVQWHRSRWCCKLCWNCSLSFVFNSTAVAVLTLFIIILFCSLVVASRHLSNGKEIKYVTVIQRDHDYKRYQTIPTQVESNLLCLPAFQFSIVMAQLQRVTARGCTYRLKELCSIELSNKRSQQTPWRHWFRRTDWENRPNAKNARSNCWNKMK